MMFMKAHGNAVQRGYPAYQSGAISGFLAGWAPLAIATATGGLAALGDRMGLTPIGMGVVGQLVMTVSGAAYGWLLPRAAADRAGCWLFGLAYGFAMWMIAPGAVMPLILGRPVAVGYPAVGLLAGCLVYGLLLGLLYPFVLGLLMRRQRGGARRRS